MPFDCNKSYVSLSLKFVSASMFSISGIKIRTVISVADTIPSIGSPASSYITMVLVLLDLLLSINFLSTKVQVVSGRLSIEKFCVIPFLEYVKTKLSFSLSEVLFIDVPILYGLKSTIGCITFPYHKTGKINIIDNTTVSH